MSSSAHKVRKLKRTELVSSAATLIDGGDAFKRRTYSSRKIRCSAAQAYWSMVVHGNCPRGAFAPLLLAGSTYVNAGTDPFTGGTGELRKSTDAKAEKLYLNYVEYVTWKELDGSNVVHDMWAKVTIKYHPLIVDYVFEEHENSHDGVTYHYDKDDYGIVTTSGSSGARRIPYNQAGYTPVAGRTVVAAAGATTQGSRTSSYAEWTKTDWSRSITLSELWGDGTKWDYTVAEDRARAWRDDSAVDIRKPVSDLSPTTSETVKVEGTSRILLPIPRNHSSITNLAKYFHTHIGDSAGPPYCHMWATPVRHATNGIVIELDRVASVDYMNHSGYVNSALVYRLLSHVDVYNNAALNSQYGRVYVGHAKVLFRHAMFSYAADLSPNSEYAPRFWTSAGGITNGTTPPRVMLNAAGNAIVRPPNQSQAPLDVVPQEVFTWRDYWVYIKEEDSSLSSFNRGVFVGYKT